MNNTRTTTQTSDDDLRAAASEIHASAPRPHPWDSLNTEATHPQRSEPTRSGRILISVAAASILLLGVIGTMAAIDRGGPPASPAASDVLPTVSSEVQPGAPVVVQPALSEDIDAIPVSGEASDWADRALFPIETPAGFTIESVSRSMGGDLTESGGVDTGDVVVKFITMTPAGGAGDARVTIETVPAGIGAIDSDVEPETVITANDAEWDVYIEQTADGLFFSTSYIRTQGVGGTVSLTAARTAEVAKDETVAFLESLRLVRVDEIPTEVVDLNRLPVVATVEPDDASSGFIRAQHTTNAWCLVTRIGNGGVSGCGFRIDPADTPAVFVELSYSDQNIVTVAGMAAPGATTIEVDLTDGTTLSVKPTYPVNGFDGIGFWAATHIHNGPIPQEGPVVTTRVLDAVGTVLGEVQAP